MGSFAVHAAPLGVRLPGKSDAIDSIEDTLRCKRALAVGTVGRCTGRGFGARSFRPGSGGRPDVRRAVTVCRGPSDPAPDAPCRLRPQSAEALLGPDGGRSGR